ncbi:reverse transcriptase domain-containing protein [Tanacetum coccineum]
MSIANQQTLAESGADGRPSILEKRSYVPWASPYKRKEIVDPNNNSQKILEPIKDLSTEDQKQYYADIKVMNYILQGIPNDIYNSVDAFNDAQNMWNQIKRLMQGTNISKQERYSRLMNEFDKFAAEDGESLTSVYERNAGRTNRNQSTNAGNGLVQKIEEYDQNVQKVPRTESAPGKTNVQCYNCNRKGHYARECPKPRVCDAMYFREQMLLAAKDEAEVNLDAEENDFMLMNAYGDEQLEELNASVIMMARIQPTDDMYDVEPTYDVELISEVNASQIDMINGLLSKSDHEHRNHEKLETVIHTSADDQIDSNISFYDPFVDYNS